MNAFKLPAALLMASLVAGCSTKNEAPKLDYQTENRKVVSLEVPPDLDNPSQGNVYNLPAGGSVRASDVARNRQAAANKAGSPVLAIEHVEQTCRVQAHLFSRRPDYLLRVRGMSMRDAGIIDGDWLAVQSAREAYNGQIVVARLGDEVTVKRFYRHGDAIELHPENPDYAPITVPCGEPFAIEGLAVGLIRSNMLI